jgi:hypothetical protein
LRTALEKEPENQSRKREPSSRENANHPVAETRHSTEYPSLLNTNTSEELRGTPRPTPSLDGKAGTQKMLGDSDNVPPVAETRTVNRLPVAETRTVDIFALPLAYNYEALTWGARQIEGLKLNAKEVAEMKRRNEKHLTPADIEADPSMEKEVHG